jgi:hypothetical protein
VMNPPGLDPEFASRLKREGGASGDVRISLLWNNRNDLDLRVTPPSGEQITYQHKRSACGGHLDIDMNFRGRMSNQPIENTFWAHGGAPAGTYQVHVMQFNQRDGSETDFRVEVVAGNEVSHFTGHVTGNENALVTKFHYSGGPFEILEATAAVDRARTIASEKLLAQAVAHEAEFVIGSDMQVELREGPCGFAGCELNDLDVVISALGTGIRKIPNWKRDAQPVPPLLLSMMPLGRRRDVDLGGEDDEDDIRVAAEEAEELALELDEQNAPDEKDEDEEAGESE